MLIGAVVVFFRLHGPFETMKLCNYVNVPVLCGIFRESLVETSETGHFVSVTYPKIYLSPSKMATSIEIPLRDTEDEVEFT